MSLVSRPRLRALLLLAAMPLLYLPLRAAEAPPPEEPPAQEAEQAVPPAEPEPPAQPPANGDGASAQEQVSLDNNLSFPVDI